MEVSIVTKLLKHNKTSFDIVNYHNFPIEVAACRVGLPSVWMCNEPPAVILNPAKNTFFHPKTIVKKIFLAFERQIVRRDIDIAVVSDEYNQERFATLYGRHADIINYGIDYEFFAASVQTVKDERHFTVVQVGMITELKNQMASVKAIERLKETIPNIRLILAGHGNGSYFNDLKRYIAEHGLESHIILTGHITREKVRELYHMCNVMLHPVCAQGGWLSPFEAISAQIPIIVSEELTASPIIRHHKLGIVTNNYVDALRECYKNSDYGDMVKRADWVRNNLSWDVFSSKMLDTFYKVLNP